MDLVTKFLQHVDERFASESRSSLLAKAKFSFAGAAQIAVWTVDTGTMQDYLRNDETTGESPREVLDEVNAGRSLYGSIERINAGATLYNLEKDRSFTFIVDALDLNETAGVLGAAEALARQTREKIIPEVDTFVINKMIAGAGTKPAAKALTEENIYEEIIAGNAVLDENMVPESDRVLLVTPQTLLLLKKCEHILLDSDIAESMILRGAVAQVDGLKIVKIPSSRVPSDFGFMIAHPSATAAPEKLRSFNVHVNPPGINGSLIEGRINYGAFVLPNKTKGIYCQAITES